MTYVAEERALAEVRKQRLYAERHLRQLKTTAEGELLQMQRIYDWSDVRLAEARMRCWDQRLAKIEEALKRCKEKRQRD